MNYYDESKLDNQPSFSGLRNSRREIARFLSLTEQLKNLAISTPLRQRPRPEKEG